ncbi:MAG: SHOCT domain-containing protein [Desulfobacteraceae bacterium]|nr:SHOCT domain-containing protein [Desulfobacteraceae bacterium]
MITKRTLKIMVCQVLALAILGMGMFQSGLAKTPKTTQELDLLFVQNATSGTFDGKTLTLKGVGPTIFFTDRPNRVEGHLRTEVLIEEWGKGADSLAADPPNAALSILDENAVKSIVVELFDPILAGTTLSYRVKVLQGKIPPTFKMASLFIDHLRRPGAFIGAALVGGVIGHSIAKKDSEPKTTVVVQDPGTYYVRHYPPPPPRAPKPTVEERIQKLDDLAANGYITPEEYKARKKEILDSI